MQKSRRKKKEKGTGRTKVKRKILLRLGVYAHTDYRYRGSNVQHEYTRTQRERWARRTFDSSTRENFPTRVLALPCATSSSCNFPCDDDGKKDSRVSTPTTSASNRRRAVTEGKKKATQRGQLIPFSTRRVDVPVLRVGDIAAHLQLHKAKLSGCALRAMDPGSFFFFFFFECQQ